MAGSGFGLVDLGGGEKKKMSGRRIKGFRKKVFYFLFYIVDTNIKIK